MCPLAAVVTYLDSSVAGWEAVSCETSSQQHALPDGGAGSGAGAQQQQEPLRGESRAHHCCSSSGQHACSSSTARDRLYRWQRGTCPCLTTCAASRPRCWPST